MSCSSTASHSHSGRAARPRLLYRSPAEGSRYPVHAPSEGVESLSLATPEGGLARYRGARPLGCMFCHMIRLPGRILPTGDRQLQIVSFPSMEGPCWNSSSGAMQFLALHHVAWRRTNMQLQRGYHGPKRALLIKTEGPGACHCVCPRNKPSRHHGLFSAPAVVTYGASEASRWLHRGRRRLGWPGEPHLNVAYVGLAHAYPH